jgi:hypothetical protein
MAEKTKRIKPLENYNRMSDQDVVSRATAVQTALTGNPNFPSPPIELPALKAAIEALAALIAESLDGSKKVIAEKKKQRKAVINMLRLLGRYVEVMCKEDMAIFKSSGFEAAATPVAAQPQPIDRPGIRGIDHAPVSGGLVIRVKPSRKARSYVLRFAPIGSGGAPGNWTEQLATSVKSPITIDGLTPGTVYAVQVKALGKLGYTEWSDSALCMCT